MAKRLEENQEVELRNAARDASTHAICTYSKFHVGCAIMLKDGRFIKGFNIENSGYSATICAERVAMVSAISQYGVTSDDIIAIGIYLESDCVGSPCGVCRQFLYEVCPHDIPVYMFNGKGPEEVSTLADLLPYGFSKENLI